MQQYFYLLTVLNKNNSHFYHDLSLFNHSAFMDNQQLIRFSVAIEHEKLKDIRCEYYNITGLT